MLHLDGCLYLSSHTGLLREEAEGVVFPNQGSSVTRVILGEGTISGVEVRGVCLDDTGTRKKELKTLLSDEKIAGYSRKTEVAFYDATERL